MTPFSQQSRFNALWLLAFLLMRIDALTILLSLLRETVFIARDTFNMCHPSYESVSYLVPHYSNLPKAKTWREEQGS